MSAFTLFALGFHLPLSKQLQQTAIKVAAPALAAGVLAAAPMVAFAADKEVGRSVFEGNCKACHNGGRNVISMRRATALATKKWRSTPAAQS